MCFLAILAAAAMEALASSPAAKTAGAPGVSARSAILICADDGSVLWEKDAHRQAAMASTTKIMTALLTLEEAERSGDPAVEITQEMVAVEGSSMGLRAGDKLTLSNLAAGMLLASGNDAANAAAVCLGGGQEGFAELMNRRAEEIGMTETHFVTPSGLDDEEHYSTAYDMALLAREAMENQVFAEIAGRSAMQVEFLEPARKQSYQNHNKLLRLYEGCTGVKTGFTKKAGRCLVSAAARNGTNLIAVTLDAPDDWNDHMALFNYGFATIETVSLDGSGTPESLPVAGGTRNSLSLRAGEGVKFTIPAGQGAGLSRQVLLPRFVYGPVEEGEQVGEVLYRLGEEDFYSVPIFAAEAIPAPAPEPGFWQSLWRQITSWFSNESAPTPTD